MDEKSLFSYNSMVLEELKPGDLVQFPRGLYSHWAVYIGNSKLVHLAGDDNDGLDVEVKTKHMFTISGVKFNKAKVCIDDFWKVVDGSKARKNNSHDQKTPPLPQSEIVMNALKKLGEVGYNVMYSNCEHFAKWCRYGIPKSDQVDSVITGAAIGFTAATLVGAVHALAKYFKSDEEEEEEKEKTRKNKLKNKQ